MLVGTCFLWIFINTTQFFGHYRGFLGQTIENQVGLFYRTSERHTRAFSQQNVLGPISITDPKIRNLFIFGYWVELCRSFLFGQFSIQNHWFTGRMQPNIIDANCEHLCQVCWLPSVQCMEAMAFMRSSEINYFTAVDKLYNKV